MTSSMATAAVQANPEAAVEIVGNMMAAMEVVQEADGFSELSDISRNFDMGEQMAQMATNIATQSAAASPEIAAEVAGAMMEQMAEIPGVSPEDMAEFNNDMAAQVAQLAPATAGDVLGAMAAADPGASFILNLLQ